MPCQLTSYDRAFAAAADDIRSRVAGVGGTISTLIGFLKKHGDNASVCEAVCLALLNLGVDRQSTLRSRATWAERKPHTGCLRS